MNFRFLNTDKENTHKDRVVLCCTDAASAMKKSSKTLLAEKNYNKMTHVTCIVHAIHRVCVTIRRTFPKLDRFMTSMRSLFTHSPNRIRVFIEVCNNLKRPPAPSGTRFGSWIQCVNYYTPENLNHLSRFVERLKTDLLTKTESIEYNDNKLVLLVAADDEDLNFDSDNDNEKGDDVEEFEVEVLPTKRKNKSSLPNSDVDEQNGDRIETSPKKKRKKQSLTKERRHRKISGFTKLQALCLDKEIIEEAAYIQKHFEFIPRYLKKLQTENMETKQAIAIVEKMGKRLHHEIPNIRPAIIEHFDDIFNQNKGYLEIKDYLVNGIARGAIAQLSEEQKIKLDNADLTSIAPERIFSMHKAFYRDNRRRFKFSNVKMFITSKCILNRVSKCKVTSNILTFLIVLFYC